MTFSKQWMTISQERTVSRWLGLVGLGMEVRKRHNLPRLMENRKTEIAVQYCHNYRQKTPESHIFWVYGSTRQSFDDAYRRIATELEIPGCEDSLFEQRKAVPRELGRRETGPWLMIVDNADEYSIYFPPHDKALSESEQSEYLAYCLPYGAENGGRLIVTTRNTRVGADIMDDSPIIEIPKLAPVDARKLLGSRVPKEKWEYVQILKLSIVCRAKYHQIASNLY